MKNNRLIMLGILILVLPLINSLDNSIPITCGGNSEILIGCLNNQDLIFLGNLVTVPSGKGGQSLEPIEEVKPEVIYVPKEPATFWSNLNKFLKSKGLNQLDIYVLGIFLVSFLFVFLYLVFKPKKRDKNAS